LKAPGFNPSWSLSSEKVVFKICLLSNSTCAATPRRGWDLQRHLSRLRARRHTWREIYWHLWGAGRPTLFTTLFLHLVIIVRQKHGSIDDSQYGVALQVAFARQTLKPVFSLDRL
jgi:hypothetical protein